MIVHPKHGLKFAPILALPLLLFGLLFATSAYAVEETPTATDGPEIAKPAPQPSHRLIVELESPPLAVAFQAQQLSAASQNNIQSSSLNPNGAFAQGYIAQLQAEQQAFVGSMLAALPGARVSTFINELGAREEATYQVVFNGMSIDPGALGREAARVQLERMAGVKAVYDDIPYVTQLYTSTALINAPMVWNSPDIGGIENAGAGIRFASMDGGVHKDAPMMSGEGYAYPDGYGPNGLGLTANNNGKIIASRVYFRDWDPPSAGDENPWPGVNGTSHGIHTASTAAGDVVENADYLGFDVGMMSGVAPKAYVMSYRVFYASVNGNESFYTTEGVAALEDIVKDGAQVVQNSWGEGPISEGGPFAPLDTALINAVKAGVFVSMSAGNSGPGLGTGDHASPDYINVAASTTGGTLAAGQLGITGNDALQEMSFGTAAFGGDLDLGIVATYPFVTAASVDPANVEGCNAFPAGAFDGVAAVISRGNCFFSDKVYNAEQAGATFVMIYNNEGGDEFLDMSCGGDHCDEGAITIAGIMISENNGNAVLAHFDATGAAGSELVLSTIAFQAGNDADIITDFSSRGPAPSNYLKPDIAAPGVNILAHGYTTGATGEARHLGYGQISGTSMAGPHVAGAAVLLKQLYPQWSPDAIKSAMMSTAKYMEVYNPDGSPAQPLDMGAGRLDIGAAMDPGVILDPPSLSFGMMPTGTQKTINVQVVNVSNAAETYTLSTLYTGDSFTQTTELPGVTVDPQSITIEPGDSAQVQITMDTASSAGLGDNQGYVVMTGDTHEAHMPAWARVSYAQALADVLIIDNDGSSSLGNYDYLWYYTSALDELGYTYEVIDADANVGLANTIPDATTLSAYKAIIHYTGDNYQPDGTFASSTALTNLDKDRLVEYLNGGGSIIAMGQDLAGVLGAAIPDAGVSGRDFYYVYRLGANYIQDSVSNAKGQTQPIIADPQAPAALAGTIIDLMRSNKLLAEGSLSGDNEVPAVDSAASGTFSLHYDIPQNMLEFSITIVPSDTTPITVTGAHIHQGAADANGDVIRTLDLGVGLPAIVTDTLTLAGVISPSLTADEIALMAEGGMYINIHTTDNLAGELRDQIMPETVDNQFYVDELDNEFHDGSQDPNDNGTTSESNLGSVPLFRYVSPYNMQDGTVALAHRDQPSLERPGTTYSGSSIYASFGLEGMSEGLNATTGITPTTRADLLGAFLTWSWSSAAAVEVVNSTPENASDLHMFTATLAEGDAEQIRWDFGDGSGYTISEINVVGHHFTKCGTHTVRAEITDSLGTVSIGSVDVDISKKCTLNLTAMLQTDNDAPIVAGQAVAVTVAYTNTGDAPISSVLEMIVPLGTTFSGNSDAGWSCAAGDAAGTVCTLSITELAGGTSGSAPFEVIVDAVPVGESAEIVFANASPQSTDGSVLLQAAGSDVTFMVLAPTSLNVAEEPLDNMMFLPFVKQ